MGSKGRFSVKSLYNALTINDLGPYHKKVWQGKVPTNIKIFLWMVINNAILTKDNMIKRKWPGDPTCFFCKSTESVDHLLFQCSMAKAIWAIVVVCIGASNVPNSIIQSWNWCEHWLSHGKQFHTLGIAAICWAIWKTRNKICFEDKKIHDPISVVCYACALMKYWAGLYGEADKEALIAGGDSMLKIAIQLLSKKKKMQDDRQIADVQENDE